MDYGYFSLFGVLVTCCMDHGQEELKKGDSIQSSCFIKKKVGRKCCGTMVLPCKDLFLVLV